MLTASRKIVCDLLSACIQPHVRCSRCATQRLMCALQACRVFLGILWSVIVIIPWSVFVVAASACAAVAGTFLATCKANYRRTLGGVAQAESEKTGFGCLAGVVQAAALSWVALLPLRFSVRVCSVRRRLNIFCTLPPSYACRLDIASCPRRHLIRLTSSSTTAS